MTTSAEQIRAFTGPAILSYAFRPFFLFGALWAAAAVAVWLPMLRGHVVLPSAFTPIEWHVHELIYGYVLAAVAGFLLTATPSWTGRLPVVGKRGYSCCSSPGSPAASPSSPRSGSVHALLWQSILHFLLH